MKKQYFAVFTDTNAKSLQELLNGFSALLPPTARIRRTQLAQSTMKMWAAGREVETLQITALINYEVEE